MRTIRIDGRGKRSLFLVAETELDKSLVGALRTFGAVAIYLHRELPDKPFAELVRGEVEEQMDGEHLARELMGRDAACRHGRIAPREDEDGRCFECLGERRQELLEALAEVEVRVLCCPGAKADGAGHDGGCAAVPAQEDRAAAERRHRLGVARGLARALARWQGLAKIHLPEQAAAEFERQMAEDIADETGAADVSPWGLSRDERAPTWPVVVRELLEVAEAAEDYVSDALSDAHHQRLEGAVARLQRARRAARPVGLSS